MKKLIVFMLVLVLGIFCLASCNLNFGTGDGTGDGTTDVTPGGDDDTTEEECKHSGGTATCAKLAVCSKCGAEYGELANRHLPESKWTPSADGTHYHACANGCATRFDETPCDGTATCKDPAQCSVCGQKHGTPDESLHVISEEWTSLNGVHYKTCANGCGKHFEAAICDKTEASCSAPSACKVCEKIYAPKLECNVPDEWLRAENEDGSIYHYHQCVDCGTKYDEEVCAAPEGAVIDCCNDAYCTVCEGILSNPDNHTVSEELTYDTTAGTHYYACLNYTVVTDENGNETTVYCNERFDETDCVYEGNDCAIVKKCQCGVEDPSGAMGHDQLVYVSNENGTHHFECSKCGVMSGGPEDCTYVGATCMTEGECECGQKSIVADNHNWADVLTPIPGMDGSHQYACTNKDADGNACTAGKGQQCCLYVGANCTVEGLCACGDTGVNPRVHVWKLVTNADNKTHTEVCEYHSDVTGKTYDCVLEGATCNAEGECVCGNVGINPDNHDWNNVPTHIQDTNTHYYICNNGCTNTRDTADCVFVGATCITEGTCACGNKSIVAYAHSWSTDWTYNADTDTHYNKCIYGCGAINNEAACTPTVATCVAESVCSVCNAVFGAIDENNHSEGDLVYNNDNHYNVCTNGCGTHLNEAAHQYGNPVTTVEATAGYYGEQVRGCKICDHEITEKTAKVEILPVKGGASGIVVLIHDDGTLTTALKLDEMWAKYGLVGDVAMQLNASVISSGTRDDLTDDRINGGSVARWREILATNRWKISSHSMTHKFWGDEKNVVDDKTLMEYEIVKSQQMLRNLFPGQHVLTWCYPGFTDQKNAVGGAAADIFEKVYSAEARELIEATYISGRGGLGIVIPVLDSNGAWMNSGADSSYKASSVWNYFPAFSLGDSNVNTAIEAINTAANDGGLAIMYCHKVVDELTGGSNEMTTASMEQIAAALSEQVKSGKIWNTHYEDAILYLREAQSADVTVLAGDDSLVVILTDGESRLIGDGENQTEAFSYPLTVKLTAPKEWEAVKIQQGDRVSYALTTVEDGEATFYADIVPDSDEAIITPVSVSEVPEEEEEEFIPTPIDDVLYKEYDFEDESDALEVTVSLPSMSDKNGNQYLPEAIENSGVVAGYYDGHNAIHAYKYNLPSHVNGEHKYRYNYSFIIFGGMTSVKASVAKISFDFNFENVGFMESSNPNLFKIGFASKSLITTVMGYDTAKDQLYITELLNNEDKTRPLTSDSYFSPDGWHNITYELVFGENAMVRTYLDGELFSESTDNTIVSAATDVEYIMFTAQQRAVYDLYIDNVSFESWTAEDVNSWGSNSELCQHIRSGVWHTGENNTHYDACAWCGGQAYVTSCDFSAGDCVTAVKCSVCDNVGTNNNTHKSLFWQGDGEATHWQTCSACGSEEKLNVGSCIFTDATCSAEAKCRLCDNMGLNPDNHTDLKWYGDDANAHWQQCSACESGEKLNEGTCDFSGATCVDKGVCPDCGNVGELDPDNHGDAAWYNDGNGNHWHQCESCDTVLTEVEACDAHVCGMRYCECGYDYGFYKDHNYTGWTGEGKDITATCSNGCGDTIKVNDIGSTVTPSVSDDGKLQIDKVKSTSKAVVLSSNETSDTANQFKLSFSFMFPEGTASGSNVRFTLSDQSPIIPTLSVSGSNVSILMRDSFDVENGYTVDGKVFNRTILSGLDLGKWYHVEIDAHIGCCESFYTVWHVIGEDGSEYTVYSTDFSAYTYRLKDSNNNFIMDPTNSEKYVVAPSTTVPYTKVQYVSIGCYNGDSEYSVCFDNINLDVDDCLYEHPGIKTDIDFEDGYTGTSSSPSDKLPIEIVENGTEGNHVLHINKVAGASSNVKFNTLHSGDFSSASFTFSFMIPEIEDTSAFSGAELRILLNKANPWGDSPYAIDVQVYKDSDGKFKVQVGDMSSDAGSKENRSFYFKGLELGQWYTVSVGLHITCCHDFMAIMGVSDSDGNAIMSTDNKETHISNKFVNQTAAEDFQASDTMNGLYFWCGYSSRAFEAYLDNISVSVLNARDDHHSGEIVANNDGTHSYFCPECGGVYATESCDFSSGTCTEKGKCTLCDNEGYNENAHSQLFWDGDGNGNHWQQCMNCGTKTIESECTYSNATCYTAAACDKCGKSTGLNPDKHENLVLVNDGAGTHWYTCTCTGEAKVDVASCVAPCGSDTCECGYKFSYVGQHSFSDWETVDSKTYQVCSNCGEQGTEVTIDGGNKNSVTTVTDGAPAGSDGNVLFVDKKASSSVYFYKGTYAGANSLQLSFDLYIKDLAKGQQFIIQFADHSDTPYMGVVEASSAGLKIRDRISSDGKVSSEEKPNIANVSSETFANESGWYNISLTLHFGCCDSFLAEWYVDGEYVGSSVRYATQTDATATTYKTTVQYLRIWTTGSAVNTYCIDNVTFNAGNDVVTQTETHKHFDTVSNGDGTHVSACRCGCGLTQGEAQACSNTCMSSVCPECGYDFGTVSDHKYAWSAAENGNANAYACIYGCGKTNSAVFNNGGGNDFTSATVTDADGKNYVTFEKNHNGVTLSQATEDNPISATAYGPTFSILNGQALTGEKVTVSFDFYLDRAFIDGITTMPDLGNYRIVQLFFNSYANEAEQFHKLAIIAGYAEGSTDVNNASGWSIGTATDGKNGNKYELDKWYNIEIVMYTAAKTMLIYVDGVLDTKYTDCVAGKTIDRIFMLGQNRAEFNMGIDNVVFSSEEYAFVEGNWDFDDKDESVFAESAADKVDGSITDEGYLYIDKMGDESSTIKFTTTLSTTSAEAALLSFKFKAVSGVGNIRITPHSNGGSAPFMLLLRTNSSGFEVLARPNDDKGEKLLMSGFALNEWYDITVKMHISCCNEFLTEITVTDSNGVSKTAFSDMFVPNTTNVAQGNVNGLLLWVGYKGGYPKFYMDDITLKAGHASAIDEHHTFSDWTADGEGNHYKGCSQCDGKFFVEACTVSEDWTQGVNAEGKSYHYNTCSVCSGKYNEELCTSSDVCYGAANCEVCLNTSLNKPEHVISEDWTFDAETDTHFHACENEGCNLRVDEAECDFVGGTCSVAAKCAVCDNEGTTDEHKATDVLSFDAETDTHYYACEYGCGTRLDEAKCVFLFATCATATPCSFCDNVDVDNSNHRVPTDIQWLADAENLQHYYLCADGCGAAIGAEDCVFSNSDCANARACDKCSNTALNPDNHAKGDEYIYDEENKRHYYICANGCGTEFDVVNCAPESCLSSICVGGGHDMGYTLEHQFDWTTNASGTITGGACIHGCGRSNTIKFDAVGNGDYTNLSVGSTEADGSGNALLWHKENNAKSSGYMPTLTVNNSTALSGEKVIFSFNFYLDSAVIQEMPGSNLTGTGFRHIWRIHALNGSDNFTTTAIGLNTDGTWWIGENGGGNVYETSFATDKWYNIQLAYNTTTGVVETYVDGALVGSYTQSSYSVTSINSIQFQAMGRALYDAYFDDAFMFTAE